MVDDCPGCPVGQLDQAIDGDGAWDITWQLRQCNVGNGPVYYSFQGSNPFYIKMAIFNTRWGLQ